MDAFYAAVEQRDRPELRGTPVIVGGTPEGRGVVSAASYEARTFGVHSAMPASTARRLCPHGNFLRGRMNHYADVSRQIHEVLHRYTPLVEPVALDEAYLDVTGSTRLWGPADEMGREIKRAIRQETGLTASVGVAPNKFLAKLASDLEKPDGFVVITPEAAAEVLGPLPVGRIGGIGKAAARILERLGVRTIAQLRGLPLDVLTSQFGKAGHTLYRLARGEDPRPVVADAQAKSLSAETTFEQDIDDRVALRAWLLNLTELVSRRLRRRGYRGSTVSIKVRFADFRTITRSQSLREPTDRTTEIWQAVCALFEGRVPRTSGPVRLLGVGMTNLHARETIQKTLFDDPESDRLGRLDAAADAIRDRFGVDSLDRAAGLSIKPPRQ